MKQLLLGVALAALLATHARAGSITITVVNDAGATVATRVATISTADINRVANAMKTRYGQIDTGTKDGQGQPIMRVRTNAEAFAALISGFLQGMIDATKQEETNAATVPAASAIAPITAN